VLQQSRLAFGAPPPVMPLELEPRERASMVRSAGSRVTRAGTAVGGFALETSRGLRAAVGRATRSRGKRGTDGEIDDGTTPDS
jgi:hypothetical protein